MPSEESDHARGDASREIGAAVLQAAADPATTPARLLELLDLVEVPSVFMRIAIARAQGRQADAANAIEVARSDAMQRLQLAEAIAANPGLDRDGWMRALEFVPATAVRNPAFRRLLDEGQEMLRDYADVAALGELAKHCLRRPEDRVSEDALIEIVRLGSRSVPRLDRKGAEWLARFAQREIDWYLAQKPLIVGDIFGLRHSGEDRPEWAQESMLHCVGNVVVDVLERSTSERVVEALRRSVELGADLFGVGHRWMECLGDWEVASHDTDRFDGRVLLHCHGHSCSGIFGWAQTLGHPVLAWPDMPAGHAAALRQLETAGVNTPLFFWVRDDATLARPGWFPGRVVRSGFATAPGFIRDAVTCLTTRTPISAMEDLDDEHAAAFRDQFGLPSSWGTQLPRVQVWLVDEAGGRRIEMITQFEPGESTFRPGPNGIGLGRMCLLRDCHAGRPFPEREIVRLATLYGEDSSVVEFAKAAGR